MRAYLILITVFLSFSDPLRSQEEYVVKDSTFSFSEKNCGKFTKHAAKKCDRLTARLRKTTDAYLSKFQKTEDALLHSLCSTDERHAESLMRGSLYSHRRMESQLGRKGNDQLNSYVPEFDSLDIASKYIVEKSGKNNNEQSCNCDGLKRLRQSQANLKAEMKRAELVNSYIKEQTQYLHQLGSKYPGMNSQLLSLDKMNGYLDAQTNEYLSLFTDRSGIEKRLFSILGSVPGFAEFASTKGALASLRAPISQPATGSQSMESALALFEETAKANGRNSTELLNPTNFHADQLKNGKEKISIVNKEISELEQHKSELKEATPKLTEDSLGSNPSVKYITSIFLHHRFPLVWKQCVYLLLWS